jgi:hypothetical protein
MQVQLDVVAVILRKGDLAIRETVESSVCVIRNNGIKQVSVMEQDIPSSQNVTGTNQQVQISELP